MAVIKNIWAENANNKNDNFTETQIGDGITTKSSILSSQLNGIAYRDEKFIDLLQRANAYNPNKTYNQGDLCFVAVNFKKAIDTAGKRYIMIFTSNLNNNTAEPLVKKNATSFSVDNSLAVPLYTIVQNDSTTMLSSYANSAYWNANDMTMGDLSNAVNLVVSGNSTFKKSLNIDGNLTMPSASMSNGILKCNIINLSNVEGVSTGNATTINTPAYNLTSSSKNIINAEWFYKKDKERMSSLLSEYEVVSLFNNSNKWTECDYIYIQYYASLYTQYNADLYYDLQMSFGDIFTPLEILLIGLTGKQYLQTINETLNRASFGVKNITNMNEYSNPFEFEPHTNSGNANTGQNYSFSCVGFKKK